MAYNGPKITDEALALAIEKSNSISEALRLLNRHPGGTSHAHYSKRVKELGISTKHFTRSTNGGGTPLKTSDLILVNDSSAKSRTKAYQLRRAMLDVGFEARCAECSISGMWNDKPLTLEIDHIDGNWRNNSVKNLRFLCPNCHSQTDTYGYTVK